MEAKGNRHEGSEENNMSRFLGFFFFLNIRFLCCYFNSRCVIFMRVGLVLFFLFLGLSKFCEFFPYIVTCTLCCFESHLRSFNGCFLDF